MVGVALRLEAHGKYNFLRLSNTAEKIGRALST